MMNLGTDYGIREGAWADLVVTDCEDVSALVSGGPDCMQVLAKGRPVAAPASPAMEAIRALEDVP
jgi:cytosine deaminase